MSRAVRALVLLATIATVVVLPMGSAPSHPERAPATWEDVYPPAVANVTQDPWHVARGDDVAVTVTLREGWDEPRAVLLRHCRVEPDYVCWPTSARMQRVSEGGGEWVAVIEWNGRFMHAATRHVGYNVSLAYENGTTVEAPTASPNAPSTFPANESGRYFFYSLSAASKPLPGLDEAPLLVGLALLLGLGTVALPRRRTGRRFLGASPSGGVDGAP